MELNQTERSVIFTILEKVAACMTKDGKEYYDNGNFIMMLEESEMKALRTGINKI